MAKVLSKAGSYVGDTSLKKNRQMFLLGIITMTLLGGVVGYIVGWQVPFRSLPSAVVITIEIAAVGTALTMGKKFAQAFDRLERERKAGGKAGNGEVKVSKILSDLPGSALVVQDFGTPVGNLEHIVVAQTGLFFIETKLWKGVVTADGGGELLLNGAAPTTPAVKPFVSRAMVVKEEVEALCGFQIRSANVLLVFPISRLEAAEGSTGDAHCVGDDQLASFILGFKCAERLSDAKVGAIGEAFATLMKAEHLSGK
jgi:hypothetical protein